MSRKKGNIAEEKACRFLIDLGFGIVERNFYCKFGEIDIIAKKSDILHFIEVKSAEEYEIAIRNITPKKLFKIQRTGDVYLKKNSIECDYMYDAVIVTPVAIELLENITF
jgi:putative endonuclease